MFDLSYASLIAEALASSSLSARSLPLALQRGSQLTLALEAEAQYATDTEIAGELGGAAEDLTTQREYLSVFKETIRVPYPEVLQSLIQNILAVNHRIRVLDFQMQSQVSRMRAEIRELQSAVAALSDLPEDRPRVVKTVQIYDIADEQYSLKRPLSVTVEEYDEEVIASFSEIDAYASGSSDAEALTLLKREIVELYEDLSKTPPERLGTLPTIWLNTLNDVLIENG